MTDQTGADFTARSPEDLLACVPIVLGFVPEGSLVMLALSPGPTFNARVDLPDDDADVADAARSLLAPAHKHGATRVALCVYGDLGRAGPATRALLEVFGAGGVDVLSVVVADGRQWVESWPGDGAASPRAYDPMSHPFVTRAVVQGRVVLASRAALAASLAADPVATEEVARAMRAVPVVEPAWVGRLVAAHVRHRTQPRPRDLACLLSALPEPDCRDASWGWVTRADARDHVDFWIGVVRAAPAPFVRHPAAVLALVAWLAGDGALAWCAVERSRAGGRSGLADLVADLLEDAVAPYAWVPLGPPPALAGGDHHSGGAA